MGSRQEKIGLKDKSFHTKIDMENIIFCDCFYFLVTFQSISFETNKFKI